MTSQIYSTKHKKDQQGQTTRLLNTALELEKKKKAMSMNTGSRAPGYSKEIKPVNL